MFPKNGLHTSMFSGIPHFKKPSYDLYFVAIVNDIMIN